MKIIHGYNILPDEEIAETESTAERLLLIDLGFFEETSQLEDTWPIHDSGLEPDYRDVWEIEPDLLIERN